MTFTTIFLLAIIVSVVLLAEIVVAFVLCSKLAKHKARLKEDKNQNSTKLHSLLMIPVAVLLPISIVLIVILVVEVILFTKINVSLVKALKKVDEQEKKEDIALASKMVRHAITLEEAHSALTDEAAMHLIEEQEEPEEIVGKKATPLWLHKRYKNKTVINVDTLSQKFTDYDHVNLKTLKEKKMIAANVDYIKVLGRGTLDKCLFVEANAFSADAVKMIVLTGGHAIRFVHEKHPSIHLVTKNK